MSLYEEERETQGKTLLEEIDWSNEFSSQVLINIDSNHEKLGDRNGIDSTLASKGTTCDNTFISGLWPL